MLSDMKLHGSILIQTAAKGLTAQQMPSQPHPCQPVFVPHVQHEAFWCLQPGFGLFILSSCIISDSICTPHDCQICLQIMEIRRVIWRYRSSCSFLVFVLKIFAPVLQGSLGKLEDQIHSKICICNCSNSHSRAVRTYCRVLFQPCCFQHPHTTHSFFEIHHTLLK